MAEYTLQPSPIRTEHNLNTPVRSYADGEWTPEMRVVTSTAGFTYDIQFGYYVKIGKLVTAHYCIRLTAKGSDAGQIRMGNLPFSLRQFPNSIAAQEVSIPRWDSMTTSVYAITAEVIANTIRFYKITTAVANSHVSDLENADLSDTTYLNGTVTYYTDE